MTEPTKKQRALPHVWKRFYKLKIGENFFLGKDRLVKNSFFSGEDNDPKTLFFVGASQWVWPFRRVKTETLVRKSRIVGAIAKALAASSPFVNIVDGGAFPRGVSDVIRPSDNAKQPLDCPRVEQPNSDNANSGPSC